ncbi:MAG: glycosyltransferase family 4 protein, partial [Anaerolineae bacterium]|nr:glycosyltransferase family 4 protein [Anaerolineae bacterium]
GLTEHVLFTGWLPSVEMPAYFQNLDVLVIPSRTMPNWKEQFGRVIIEAMASQVAVVGSDSGAIPDVVGDAGLIFREGNVDDLAHQLQKLLINAELRCQLAEKGRQRVLENFTQEQIAAQTVAVYQEMLQS